MLNLDYTSFFTTDSNTNSSPSKQTVTMQNIALANRPPERHILLDKPKFCSSCSDHIRPASNSSFLSNHGINLSNNNTLNAGSEFTNKPDSAISVTFKKDANGNKEYFSAYVDEPNNRIDKADEVVIVNSVKPTIQRVVVATPETSFASLPYITQFYIGSLTVVGLFLVFRVMQKTK